MFTTVIFRRPMLNYGNSSSQNRH